MDNALVLDTLFCIRLSTVQVFLHAAQTLCLPEITCICDERATSLTAENERGVYKYHREVVQDLLVQLCLHIPHQPRFELVRNSNI